MLQGPYSSLDRDRPLIRLPFTSFAVATVLLPVTGFIACVFISLIYHFEDSTYTHCQVGRPAARSWTPASVGLVLVLFGRSRQNKVTPVVSVSSGA